MAYMSQEKKAKLAPAVKAILKKYGVKGTLAVKNYSTLVLNIKSGKIDFLKSYNETCGFRPSYVEAGFKPRVDYVDVNPYWYHEHFDGKSKEFLTEIFEAMNVGNHDRSDAQIDYYDVGWYVDVNIGKWNKPYQLQLA